MLDKLNLEGKTIVVTGGGSGLGKAMSLALAEAGADVVVAARRQNLIDETASEIQNIGRRSLAIATDVTDSKQIENLFSIVRKEFGKIDVLINNAGITGPTEPLWEYNVEMWNKKVQINLMGTLKCCRAIDPNMIKEFIEYWTEHNDGGHVLRYEQQSIFNVRKRMSTWVKNSKKFNSNMKFQPASDEDIQKREQRIEADYQQQIKKFKEADENTASDEERKRELGLL